MQFSSHFKPAWWARNAHLQTILADWLTKRHQQFPLTERLELPDQDFVDLVWTTKLPKDYDGSIIVLFHGLEGSIKSHYAYRLLDKLRQLNQPAVMMHFRGCSGVPNRLERAYHSGEISDPRFFIEHLVKLFPHCKINAVGYSLGGNVLLKYLSVYRANSLINRAVAISPPIQLAACEQKLKQGFSRIYQFHLLKRMKRNLSLKLTKIPKLAATLGCGNNLSKIKTFHQFDSLVTAPLHGFNSALDYYQQSSALPRLHNITVPSLIIHAQDDPFMTWDVIPTPEQLPSNIEYELSKHGGHVGFIGGKYPWAPQFYLEQRVIDFFNKGNKR